MSRLSRLAGALVVAASAAAVVGLLPAQAREVAALGPRPVTVVLDIDHSAFTPDRIRVLEGTTVLFVVVNDDPINHEFIVGPQPVHDRHRNGTEPEHGDRPGEVSIGAGERAVTTYEFPAAGDVEFACHLPGHYDYGMRGVVEVVDA